MTDELSHAKLVRPTERAAQCSDPGTPNIHSTVRRAGARRSFEPPVIESFYPSHSGLPSDVIDEWCGKDLLSSETDDTEKRSRHRAPSKQAFARWRKILRRAARWAEFQNGQG